MGKFNNPPPSIPPSPPSSCGSGAPRGPSWGQTSGSTAPSRKGRSPPSLMSTRAFSLPTWRRRFLDEPFLMPYGRWCGLGRRHFGRRGEFILALLPPVHLSRKTRHEGDKVGHERLLVSLGLRYVHRHHLHARDLEHFQQGAGTPPGQAPSFIPDPMSV